MKTTVNEGVIPSRRFSYDETPSTTVIMRNPIVNVVTIITTFLIRIVLHVDSELGSYSKRRDMVVLIRNISHYRNYVDQLGQYYTSILN